MPRYRLTVEYDGGGFSGWQRQENGPSIQAALEDAIAAFCGETVTVFGAGRTDAGVHALAQVAHVDLAKVAATDTIRDAVNAYLRPAPIAVLDATEVGAEFDARFSAVRRRYLYRIVNRRSPLTFDKGRAWLVAEPLDAGAMHEAAQTLIGNHDFSSFRAAACQAKSPVKTLDRLDVNRLGEEIEVCAEARSFLHNQVRILVGTLKMVGVEKWRARDVANALAARDRAKAGPTAPSDGLYLVSVEYE
ncbi:MAG: tRNA pseudouridine(38-40) synthase TruA [Alphaproteobacteria bacterium]